MGKKTESNNVTEASEENVDLQVQDGNNKTDEIQLELNEDENQRTRKRIRIEPHHFKDYIAH